MSTTDVPEIRLRRELRHEIQAIRGKWLWLVLLGIALIVLGTVLVGFPVVATLATVTILGAMIFVGGSIEVVGAFWTRDWSGFFLHLLSGVLGVVVGLMLLGNPIQGGITLTILLASFLFVGGIFKVIGSFSQRFGGWGWLLLSGVIDVVLGVLIWTELPVSGLTIIGLLVGISTIFRGVSWLMLGITLRQIPKAAI
ncbi:MAG: HdeD family acid-resistance protein [Isosphaeraceae bacterium]